MPSGLVSLWRKLCELSYIKERPWYRWECDIKTFCSMLLSSLKEGLPLYFSISISLMHSFCCMIFLFLQVTLSTESTFIGLLPMIRLALTWNSVEHSLSFWQIPEFQRKLHHQSECLWVLPMSSSSIDIRYEIHGSTFFLAHLYFLFVIIRESLEPMHRGFQISIYWFDYL